MKVYARHCLAPQQLRAGEPALLLESSWPGGAAPAWRSLDEAIDGRHSWIDAEAASIVERLGSGDSVSAIGPDSLRVNFAWLNALKLRYLLVKLLRIVAWSRQVATPCAAGLFELSAQRQRDEPYAALLSALAEKHGFALAVRWYNAERRSSPDAAQRAAMLDRPWRRLAQRLLNGAPQPLMPAERASTNRVVLCGSARWLDPVCGELLARGSNVAWLYERFALRTWLRWHGAGVGQLVCSSGPEEQSSLAHSTALSMPPNLTSPVVLHGLDLSPAIEHLLRRLAVDVLGRQEALLANIAAHFEQLQPTHLVLDEDATPLARAAIAAARRHGATTHVVQHGVPAVRLGFAPLAADRICTWGEGSRHQLLAWGVPDHKIRVTGSPWHERLVGQRRHAGTRKRPPNRHVLLLASTPPRDERPDAVGWRLTSATHEEMLRLACAAVARLDGARLTIKPHPRSSDDSILRRVLADFPTLRWQIVLRGRIEQWPRKFCCAISCGSGAGVEARLLGLPVVQLLPAGSGPALPESAWGMLGTARSGSELNALLAAAMQPAAAAEALCPLPAAALSIERNRTAAERIVDAVLEIEPVADGCEQLALRGAETLRAPHFSRRSGPVSRPRRAEGMAN